MRFFIAEKIFRFGGLILKERVSLFIAEIEFLICLVLGGFTDL